MERKLKIALIVLIILLISLVGFVGVYSKGVFSYKSTLPDYELSSELTGKRITYFKVDDGEEEKIYDKNGKEVEEIPEDANEEEYTKENVKINAEENLKIENYEKSKKILEGRLNDLGVEYYNIRLNENTGDMVVELDDNVITDTLLQYLLAKGDFSITDSEDGTLLLDRSDIKNVSVVYGNSETGAVIIYLDIKFNDKGAKKLEEVSRNYLKAEENNEGEEGEDSSNTEQKQVTMSIEGTEFLTSYFAEVMTNGELTIAVGTGTDDNTIYQYSTQAEVYTMLLNNDEMPLTYKIESTEYFSSNISMDTLYIIIGAIGAISLIIIIYLIIRFRIDGLFSSISFIAAMAMLLLMIRYTSTKISLGGMAAILVLILFDAYFMKKILERIKENKTLENVKYTTYGTYLQKLDILITLLVIAVVFTFMPEVQVFSIGMTLFYGIISLVIANLLLMRGMLITKYEITKK